MAKIIDGNLVATSIKAKITEEVKELNRQNITVSLAVILVGENPASQIYVRNKRKACEELGIVSKEYLLPADFGQRKLLELIDKLNEDTSVSGILCQFPLPEGYNEKAISEAIHPDKDVDCFHPINVGRIITGDTTFLPCTPAGIIEMLDYYNIEIEGKCCVVVGRSSIVGKPVSLLLLNRNGTILTAHTKTVNLDTICRRADILVTAAGKPNLITADMVKEGAVIIDAGINRVDGKLCGDIDFENVAKKASYVTPVPGGVGKTTIAMLMQNTVLAAKKLNKI